MKILMISLDYPPEVGGISAHVYELSHALQKQGCKVVVIARQSSPREATYEDCGGVKVYRLRLRFIAPFYGWQINRFVNEKLPLIKPDIIHIHGMAPLEGFAVKKIPLVYTNHTSGYLKRIKKGGIRRMALLKRLFKKPDLFLAPSRELLEVPFAVPAPKRFISNGVDSGKYCLKQSHRRQIRKELNLAEHDVVCIVTRRLVAKNGVIFLARATRHLKDTSLKLVFIGDGEERIAVEEELQRNFKDRYVMLGSKRHEDIIPFYSAADFSVLPSLMEATSISGLEAMASSLPLVGTKVGGIPELIIDGENGFLCEPADPEDLAEKIRLLIGADYKRMGQVSRQYIEEKFSWEQIAQRTKEAYSTLL